MASCNSSKPGLRRFVFLLCATAVDGGGGDDDDDDDDDGDGDGDGDGDCSPVDGRRQKK